METTAICCLKGRAQHLSHFISSLESGSIFPFPCKLDLNRIFILQLRPLFNIAGVFASVQNSVSLDLNDSHDYKGSALLLLCLLPIHSLNTSLVFHAAKYTKVDWQPHLYAQLNQKLMIDGDNQWTRQNGNVSMKYLIQQFLLWYWNLYWELEPWAKKYHNNIFQISWYR